MTASEKKSKGDFLMKKVVGIDTQERYKRYPSDLERRARETVLPAQAYLEEEPTVAEWFRDLKPTKESAVHYVRTLFPSLEWVPRYNLRWLMGDSIAGLTIGFVIIPQAMAYALLAQLSPEYGLYTSFTGAIFYWIFGTSKDIVIGTTAVGSLLVGSVVTSVQEKIANGELAGEYENQDIARTLSLIAGCILIFLGLFRLGWIIEFIPYVPISAFVTAASITIMSTQAPVMLGIRGINTRESPYTVIINTLKNLPNTSMDAAIGITCLVMLFAIRDFCTYMEKRNPHQKRLWVTISSLRQTFAMILFTIIAYLVHKDYPKDEDYHKFRLVGTISKGFNKAHVPQPTGELVTAIIPELPAIVIILIIEHIAIAKSFGRVFNYTIVPSQEILAQGFSNVFSPFVGGYVCTGSFGASAVLSKAGVRTPFAGLFSAFILVLALYVLTGVFYYIPNAALAGLIIHAVCNLLTPPRSLYKYWQLSPFELIVWFIGVILAMFTDLETSIYVTIALSAVLLLVRLSRTSGRFLGKVRVHQVPNDFTSPHSDSDETDVLKAEQATAHDTFVPIDRKDATNPAVEVESPYPGIFIYRFSEGFNYTNSGHHIDRLLTYVTSNSRRTTAESFARESDRLWNDAGASKPKDDHLPLLRAMVFDCSAVNNMDITAVQALVDLRASLERYASPEPVEWHFANVNNRWTRRALAVAGFGFPAADNPLSEVHWKPAYGVAPLANALVEQEKEAEEKASRVHDEEAGAPARRHSSAMARKEDEDAASAATAAASKAPGGGETPRVSPSGSESSSRRHVGGHPATKYGTLHGVNRPFFHLDLMAAVESAARDATRADERYSEERCLVEEEEEEEERRRERDGPDSPVGVPITPADSRVASP
ncbi:hypothetical protein MKZ38_009931 [Zalerion maritima]|uniref:STAS domain-containing protein n=1 Tax=Zalerion maritima TaxID=339359 RepID=A0AAD5S172_9PEZI|nr:hypothetical protein MKZ38_009931 [Zalerion maritima]